MVNKLIKMGTGDYALIQLFICILTESSRYIGSDINILDNPVNNEYRNYEYDNIGNRKYATDWDNTNMKQRLTNYYANSLNQYTQTVQSSIAKDNFTYDEDGNLTSISSGDLITKYTYNAENRLIAVEPENPTNGDKKLQFKYDYMGRRVLKQIYTLNNGNWELKTEKLFVYNGWNMFCQINVDIEDETQNPKEDYFVWGLDLSQSLQGAGGIGGLIVCFDSLTSSIYYYHYDGNGNVGQLVDSQDGKIAAHYEYDPFGNIIVADGLAANRNIYRFSTKYLDIESGLVYYGYRYYYPDLAKWMRKDCIDDISNIALLFNISKNNDINSFHNSLNTSIINKYKIIKINLPYNYISNNPINLFDLFGLSESDVKKIKEIFRTVVDEMTASGDRHINPAKNNILRTLYIISNGLFGTPYLSCGEQEERVTFELKRESYDANWSFDYNHYFIHIWGEAISNNKCDPKIIYDPWKDNFKLLKHLLN